MISIKNFVKTVSQDNKEASVTMVTLFVGAQDFVFIPLKKLMNGG
jgi:hypothetical protein